MMNNNSNVARVSQTLQGHQPTWSMNSRSIAGEMNWMPAQLTINSMLQNSVCCDAPYEIGEAHKKPFYNAGLINSRARNSVTSGQARSAR